MGERLETIAQWAPPAPSRRWASLEFAAMASPCRIITDEVGLAAAGQQLVDALEQRWSRFIASSEISALNRAAGEVCIVSPETYRLVERAEAARAETGGVFNPLVLDRLEQLGHPTSGTFVQATGDVPPASVSQEPIELYPELPAVRLPPGARFDPGGVGKGLAGDLVAEHLDSLGAERAQIELGGDVRLIGSHWTSNEWTVVVADPRDRSRILARISMPEGAIATSSVAGVHHLIDPMTGLPARTDLVAVTAIADRLWWAEVVAKVALMSGSGDAEAVLRRHGVTGLILHDDGDTTTVVGDVPERAA